MSDEPTTRDPLPPDAPDLSGTQFTIEKLLGQGGFGAAYQVFNRGLRRRCVLKLLTNKSSGVVARFFREAQVMANIDHPGITRVFEVATLPTGVPYFVMEFVDGVPLGEHLATKGILSIPEACEIAAATAEALSAAHEQGVIHRDIKLPNILITRKGQVKVIDFGIAHQRVEDFGDGPKIKTMMGQLLGTPRYMAPEQVLGLPLSPASDFYSLGVVLSLLLTGKSPFDGNAQTMMVGHVTEPPPTLTALAGTPFPEKLEALFARMLAKESHDRPSSGAALAYELRAIAKSIPEAATAARAFHDEPTMTPETVSRGPILTPALPADPSTIAQHNPHARPAARTEVRVDAARLVAIAAEPSVAYSAMDAAALPRHATQHSLRTAAEAAGQLQVPLAASPERVAAPTPVPAAVFPETRAAPIVRVESTPSDLQTFVQPSPPRARGTGVFIAAGLGLIAAVVIAIVVVRSSGEPSRAPSTAAPQDEKAPEKTLPTAKPRGGARRRRAAEPGRVARCNAVVRRSGAARPPRAAPSAGAGGRRDARPAPCDEIRAREGRQGGGPTGGTSGSRRWDCAR